jgi:RNA polymerase sigma-70 factor (ECF subfamily)
VKEQQPGAESELARELLAGNTDAFDEFVSVFQGKIFQYSYVMCGHREDAEEVAQETLMKVFESFDQLREPEHVKSWVFRIARNNCLMKRRKSLFAPAAEVSLDEPLRGHGGDSRERHLDVADHAEAPDARAFRGEVRQVLDAAIRRLSPTHRAVVLLRDVEDLSTEETADILDVSVDVVKMRLHRARLSLREHLQGHLDASDSRLQVSR